MKEVRNLTLEKIMTDTVIGVEPEKTVDHIRKLMIEYAISQVPVIENGKAIGMVSEEEIVKAYKKHGSKTKNLPAHEVMREPPRTVNIKEDIEKIVDLLHENPVLLVTEGEEIKGIITRADIVYWALDM